MDSDGFASPDEVEKFATRLPETFLLCRELGHQWRPWDARWEANEQVWLRSLRCPRCFTVREQRLDDRGNILSGTYTYPDGYLHVGFGRIAGEARGVLRLESVTRLASGTLRSADRTPKTGERKTRRSG